VLIGAELLGVLGALIAIPVAGSLQLLFRELRSGSIQAPPKPASGPPPG
jgi:predicted PurR-regulated permease PerM